MTASRLALNMIIVSGSSAEATQPVRTDRYTPARRRSSAARNDIPRYADARPINVHTEEHHRSKINSPVLPAGSINFPVSGPSIGRSELGRLVRVEEVVGLLAGSQGVGFAEDHHHVAGLDHCVPGWVR